MSETTSAPAAAPAAPDPTTDPIVAPAPATDPVTPPVAPVAEPATVEDLPEWAQRQIRELRKEDGDERIAKKTLDAIQKALNPEAPADAKVEPEALAAQLTEATQTAAQATERADAAEVKLAVVLASLELDADHGALLDSNSFLATLKGLTPDDGEKITEAITAAVEKNPKLKATRAVATSRVDSSGGSGENAVTPEQFAVMSMSDRTALYSANPALYRQLAGR